MLLRASATPEGYALMAVSSRRSCEVFKEKACHGELKASTVFKHPIRHSSLQLLSENLQPSTMFSKISTLALIAASAVALPTDTAPWVWSVKNYTSVCSAATCRYGFNVSAPAGPSGQPSFDATGCIGTSVQGDYKSCIAVGIASPGDVLSEQFNGGINVGANVSVRVVFEQ
jgi:hypothetical protein